MHLESLAAKKQRKAAEKRAGAGAKKWFHPFLMPRGAGASSGTCPQVLALEVEANRDMLGRNVFYQSLLLFPVRTPFIKVVGVVRYDVAVNAWPIGVHGTPPVFVPAAQK